MDFVIHVNSVIVNEENQILLVKERKTLSYGKYNLPGGHLEKTEKIIDCAVREAYEEVRLNIEPKYLLGVFTGVGNHHFMNYVFYSEVSNQVAAAQESEVLSCEWLSIEEILNVDEEKLLNPVKLKTIVNRVKNKQFYDLDVIKELF